jgi:phosphoglycerate dehydrogenase-like enzyme
MQEEVLITPEHLQRESAPYLDLLRGAGFAVRYPTDQRLPRGLTSTEETVAALAGVCAVIAGGDRLDREVITALPDLRVIARAGVGYDRVDVEAATERAVAVTITPTANHEGVAEHALALLFAVAKSIALGDRETRAGLWNRGATRPVRAQTLGILGLGRIGRSLATRAAALGMRVLASDAAPDAEFARRHAVSIVPLGTLLGEADYVSIHCPLTPGTRNLIDATAIERMKPGSVIINTARGGIVDEVALERALRSGHLGGAALDTFEEEPPPAHHPLLELDNVVFSPHIAGCDEVSLVNMGVESAQSIIALRRGEWPEAAVVNQALRETWRW